MILYEYRIDEHTTGVLELPLWSIITFAVLAVAVFVAFYVLRSLGIYKLAKNNGVKNAFMAFIPGVWLYLACNLISNARFFRTTIGRVALVFTIIFSVAEIGKIIFDLILYLPLVTYYLGGINKGAVILFSSQDSIAGYTPYIVNDIFVLSENYNNIYSLLFVKFLFVTDYILSLFYWVGEVIAIFVYFALFRKFTPANHVLFAILSAFGLFAPFVFAIRNKKPVDYNAFIRSRMGYGNYGNPYNQGGSQNTQNTANQTPPPDPFSDFDGKDENSSNSKSDDPFDDFN